MPVPTFADARAPAHPVFKRHHQPGASYPSIHKLPRALPFPHPGFPPVPGPRGDWINSPFSWRQNKPRRIWEEDSFHPLDRHRMRSLPDDLTDAANSFVIKGQRIQACIPPITNFSAIQSPIDPEDPLDDEADSSFDLDIESQWSGYSSGPDDLAGMDIDVAADNKATAPFQDFQAAIFPTLNNQDDYNKCHTRPPVLDGISPRYNDLADPGSSPLGPVTPFGEFVDRSVNHLDHGISIVYPRCSGQLPDPAPELEASCFTHFAPTLHDGTQDHARVSAPADASLPPLNYQKVAEPLADWMVAYVWKVCTTGMSLAPKYSLRSGQLEYRFSTLPPSYLAGQVRGLFMSTLLQPSAILLAVLYITKLPVTFAALELTTRGSATVAAFRRELLGPNEQFGITERDAADNHSVYRLVILGCMLANKWLDDHTFSNKTWYTISGVSIESLNRLESYALGILDYDLNIHPSAWSHWLEHVRTYHMSSSPIGFPNPISRPSCDPRNIIRQILGNLITTSAECVAASAHGNNQKNTPHLEPVFVKPEYQKCEANTQLQVSPDFEFNLDEDGPLREEYIPKRRGGDASVDQDPRQISNSMQHARTWERALADRSLPPPAKWSPDADEPLARYRTDRHSQYLAVQRPAMPPPAPLLNAARPYLPVYPVSQGWLHTSDPLPAPHLHLPPIQTGQSHRHVPPGLPHGHSTMMPPGRNPVSSLPAHNYPAAHAHFDFEHSDSHTVGRPPYQQAREPHYSTSSETFSTQYGLNRNLPANATQYRTSWARA